jgi:DNA-binding PadR family transcriptional regulator
MKNERRRTDSSRINERFAWRRNFGQRGWIRPSVLRVIQEGPKNGIEIMDTLEEMSHGWWRPSPGSIYPLLEQLSKERLIKKNNDGKYEISESYRKEAHASSSTDDVITNIESSISYLEELKQSDMEKFNGCKARIKVISKRLRALE